MLQSKFFLFKLHSMREERGLSRTFMRFLYNPCEPKHLAWQWQVKNSPAIARCSDSCLRRKECPPKRFFPRLKKRYIYKDLTSCKEKDVPGVKKKSTSWKEFFTYLLPPEIQKKPKLSCCRKLMEMRRQQCSSIDDWKSCDASCCWPAPLEWMGQGVLHEFPATLPPSATLPVPQPCPPPQHMVPRCVIAKMVACPVPKTKPLCLEEYAYEAPFANFQGAAPTPQPQYTIKCPLPCTDVPLVSEKSLRLSCKTYGEFKGVECPKSMFTRFLSVNVAPDGRLLPSPVSRHSPQSEMSKPSCKSFHTSTCLLSSNEDPPRNAIDNLQPNRSPINMDRLAERAGFQLGRDSQEKKKNLKMPKSPIFASRLSEEERAEEELEEVERELEMSPEEKEARQREFERLSKSPLQLLTQKQLARKGSSAASLPAIEQPLFGDKPVDLEDPPYTSQSRRSFHTSSSDWAAKKKKDSSNKQKKPKVAKEQPICGGCPAIKLAENPDPTYVEGSFKKKCRRRAAGTCKGKKIHVDPKDPPPPNPYQKCREKIYSPCLMPSGPSLALRALYSTESGSSEGSYCEQVKKLEKELECCKKLSKLKQQVKECAKTPPAETEERSPPPKESSKPSKQDKCKPKKCPRLDEVHHIQRDSCPAMKLLGKQQKKQQQQEKQPEKQPEKQQEKHHEKHHEKQQEKHHEKRQEKHHEKQQEKPQEKPQEEQQPTQETSSEKSCEKPEKVCASDQEKMSCPAEKCMEKCCEDVAKQIAKKRKKVEKAAKKRKAFEDCVEEKIRKACRESQPLPEDCLDDIKYECEKNAKFMTKIKNMITRLMPSKKKDDR